MGVAYGLVVSRAIVGCRRTPVRLEFVCMCVRVRSGVGVPTRGASARTLKTIAEIAGAAMQPYATQASRVLSAGLEDQVCGCVCVRECVYVCVCVCVCVEGGRVCVPVPQGTPCRGHCGLTKRARSALFGVFFVSESRGRARP